MSIPPPDSRTAAGWLWETVAALLMFALMREWLQPIADMSGVTDPAQILPFYAAVGSYVLIDGLRLPSWAGWPAKALVSLAVIGRLFYGGLFPWSGWWRPLLADLSLDGANLLQARWDEIGASGRSLLFLAGWALAAFVLHALILQTRQAFWFAAATLGYLVALQLWPGLDTTGGVMRTLAAGLLLAAVQRLQAFLEALRGRESLKRSAAPPGWPLLRWTGCAIAVTAVCTAAGWYAGAAHKGPVRPLDFSGYEARMAALFPGAGPASLPAFSRGESLWPSYAARTGYSSDDSRLGGSICPDNAVAFTARTPLLTYWRGETKDFYDGKGWSRKEPDPAAGAAPDVGPYPLASTNPMVMAGLTNPGVENYTPVEQEITLQRGAVRDRLLAGGSILDVVSLTAADGGPFAADRVNKDAGASAYLVAGGGPAQTLASYRVLAAVPLKDEAKLRSASADFPPAIASVYLQLPAGLPGRVAELAAQITAGQSNAFDRSLALEAYLRKTYKYSLDVPKSSGQPVDFVDAFLFDGKTGYCDYFSTAMVVMLRALGIPARWAKGYAPGEAVSDPSGAGYVVTVRNRHAHSWAEAYFPGTGWISFEPTPGFRGSVDSAPTTGDPESSAAVGTGNRLIRWHVSGLAASIASLLFSDPGTVKAMAVAGGLSALAVLAGAVLAIHPRTRRALQLRLLLRGHSRNGRKPGCRTAILDRLWKGVFRKFGPKGVHLTAREYAGSLPGLPAGQRRALDELVRLDEAVRFDSAAGHLLPKRRVAELWLRLTDKAADTNGSE